MGAVRIHNRSFPKRGEDLMPPTKRRVAKTIPALQAPLLAEKQSRITRTRALKVVDHAKFGGPEKTGFGSSRQRDPLSRPLVERNAPGARGPEEGTGRDAEALEAHQR